MRIILASQSPRRKELLGLLRLDFTIQVADIDETMDPNLPAQDEVARVSRLKAEAIIREPEDIVIAADTIVVCENTLRQWPNSNWQGNLGAVCQNILLQIIAQNTDKHKTADHTDQQRCGYSTYRNLKRGKSSFPCSMQNF